MTSDNDRVIRVRTSDELQSAVREHAYSYNKETANWEYDKGIADDLEEEYREHVTKLQSVSSVYSKADTIITGDKVQVSVDMVGQVDTTAYNDGKEITFNASLLETLDDNTITSLHGFNYHEVAHILFTPRAGSELGKWVSENKVRRAFNILEDSRIERLLISKYPSVRLYLEACITDYLLKGNPKEWADYFYLTTGRKYLDLELRQELADRFVRRHGVEIAQDLARITHEYRVLSLPSDKEKAKVLILELTKYVGFDDVQSGYVTWKGGHETREIQDKGRPTSNREQKELQDRAEQMEKGVGTETLKPPTENHSDNSVSVDNEGDIELAQQAEYNEADNRLRDKLNNRKDSIIKNEQVKGGTAEIRNAIGNGEQGATMRQANYTDKSVSVESLNVAEQFSHELERLRIENDPMWRLEQPQGRLNVARSIHADINDIDRLFDKWDIGNDNRDIEAVILLDNSGSMSFHMSNALTATWVIKKALETIDAKVSVYRFNNDGRLLYSADDKARPNEYRYIGSTGGTNPYTCLIEAERILSASDRAIKLLFVVSDGGWDNSERCDDVMARIGSIEGSKTISVLLGSFSYYERERGRAYVEQELMPQYRHNAHIFHLITEPKDLIGVARKVVTSTMTAQY